MESKPLLNRQKEDIYKLWCDIHDEDNINRKELLFDFCNENKCDIILAIDYLIDKISSKYYVQIKDESFFFLKTDIPIFNLNVFEIEYIEKDDRIFHHLKIFDNEIEDGHFVNDAPYANLKVVSTKIVKQDIELLNAWKVEVEKIEVEKKTVFNPIDISNSVNISLAIGSYDNNRSKELYNECNSVCFKYCQFNDFVNSLNNPEQCNLEVKNKNLLYVLYAFFDDLFGSEGEIKIEMLNEKFGIPQERYARKKFNYDNSTQSQKDFYKKLAEI